MNRRAWWATVHGVTKSWTLKRPNNNSSSSYSEAYVQTSRPVILSRRWLENPGNIWECQKTFSVVTPLRERLGVLLAPVDRSQWCTKLSNHKAALGSKELSDPRMPLVLSGNWHSLWWTGWGSPLQTFPRSLVFVIWVAVILTLSPGPKEDVTHLFLVCARALALPGSLALVAQLVKNPPAMQETWVQSLGREDPLEKGKATHSSILAWRIPWTI